MKFKPNLADDADISRLRYPLIASPKLDGVRATFVPNIGLRTRSLKPIPNANVNALFKSDAPLDGELIVGDPTDKECFRNTMKVVSNHTADAKDVRFFAFDIVYEGSFNSRLFAVKSMIRSLGPMFTLVEQVEIKNETELLTYEEISLEVGFEGIMLRDPYGKYKFGRSTVGEGGLLKLKRKATSEAVILGFEEQMHNANEQKTNALGYAERSSHQANLVPMGTLGALQVRDLKTGVQFNIGTGFSMAERDHIWKNQPLFINRLATYEYLPYGVKDKPRHPTFKGWRMAEDT